MRLTVNGAPREVPEGTSLSALLHDLAVDPARVAAAVNGAVVPRGQHERRTLAAGDAVEVIEAVGGG